MDTSEQGARRGSTAVKEGTGAGLKLLLNKKTMYTERHRE
jgi:hypothetical protein